MDWYDEVQKDMIITVRLQRALSLCSLLWSVHLIKIQWGPLITWVICPLCVIRGTICSRWKERHSSRGLPQFSCCSPHWNHFTQSHVVNYEVEIRPTTPCALSAACEGGVSIWELCCCSVQNREEHITQSCLVLFWSNSLWKRTACPKGLVSMPAVTSIIHDRTENKTTWFLLSGQCPCNGALWCKQWWHALLR